MSAPQARAQSLAVRWLAARLPEAPMSTQEPASAGLSGVQSPRRNRPALPGPRTDTRRARGRHVAGQQGAEAPRQPRDSRPVPGGGGPRGGSSSVAARRASPSARTAPGEHAGQTPPGASPVRTWSVDRTRRLRIAADLGYSRLACQGVHLELCDPTCPNGQIACLRHAPTRDTLSALPFRPSATLGTIHTCSH